MPSGRLTSPALLRASVTIRMTVGLLGSSQERAGGQQYQPSSGCLLQAEQLSQISSRACRLREGVPAGYDISIAVPLRLRER